MLRFAVFAAHESDKLRDGHIHNWNWNYERRNNRHLGKSVLSNARLCMKFFSYKKWIHGKTKTCAVEVGSVRAKPIATSKSPFNGTSGECYNYRHNQVHGNYCNVSIQLDDILKWSWLKISKRMASFVGEIEKRDDFTGPCSREIRNIKIHEYWVFAVWESQKDQT